MLFDKPTGKSFQMKYFFFTFVACIDDMKNSYWQGKASG